MRSTFGDILRKAVEEIPGAVGGALAAGDGETVDFFTSWEDDDWALMTAHIGILVSHIRRSLHTFHFGDIQFLQMGYGKLELAIQLVDQEYYMLIALKPPIQLGIVRRKLEVVTAALRKEMF